MQGFKYNQNVISDQSTNSEGTLCFRNNIIEERFKPISNNLTNNFINYIALAYWSKLRDFFQVFTFGIKVMKVWFMDFKREPELRQEITT